jgi:hypothetical protein
MNPETQIILDELNRRFDELETATTDKFDVLKDNIAIKLQAYDDHWERKISDLQISHGACLDVLERAATSFEDWRPGVDGIVDDIRLEVRKLSKLCERSVRERSPAIFSSTAPASALGTAAVAGGALHSPPQVLKISSAPERPFAPGQADRPIGHSVDNFHREDGFGLVTTVVHPPVKGACRLPTPPIPPQPGRFNTLGSSLGGHSQNVGGGGTGRLPKLNFPPFDGDNPSSGSLGLWISWKCMK